MVIKRYCTKKINFLVKKTLFLAITLCVIANFVLGNIVFAKNIAEINNKDIEKIKTGLDLVKAVVNFTIRDDKLKAILNTAINVGDTSTDITYGLLVLTALNEMELIDLVVSQRYKTEARDYFNSVLDERLNLLNYYTGIGYDLPRIISGNITGPVSAFTLNAFSMTNEVIDIFIALENIKTVKSYDGLWLYFDLRKSNEPHEMAWSDAKEIMGFITSTSFLGSKVRGNNDLQLESQFAVLFDKWGPHVTINKGVNEQYKKQVQKELQNTVVTAYESYEFVEKEAQPSFTERAGASLNNLLEKISKIPVFVANTGKNIQKEAQKQLNEISSQIQKLTVFIGDKLSLSPKTDMGLKVEEVSEQSIEAETNWDKLSLSQEDELSVVLETQDVEYKGGPEPSLDRLSLSKEDIQEIIDDISERVDILAQEVKELIGEEVQIEEELEEEQEEPTEEEEHELNKNIVYYSGRTSSSPPKPVFLKILITEVQIASVSNLNDEFIELYNPNLEEVDISQWSIQKTYCNSATVYKKNFETGNKIPAKGYFLIVYASSTDQNLLNLADMTHKTFGLTKNNTIYLVVNQEKIESASNVDIEDMVGFGMDIIEFRSLPAEGDSSALNPSPGQSLGRKWSTTTENYIDTNNNQGDFEIQEPTPKERNKSELISKPEPEIIEQIPPLTVVINEIAWMGTASSTNDEWVELYNNTEQDIDMANWTLNWSHGTTTHSIVFSTSTAATTTISSNGFYLIERTNDDTVSDISADKIYTGALSNDGEHLKLFDSQDNLIDEVNCVDNWFAGEKQKIGDNWLRVSMERINSTSTGTTSTDWASNNLIVKNGKDAGGNNIYGTPKAKNSVSISPVLVSDLPFDNIISEFKLVYCHSPYLVTDSLLIPKDKILFIEEGVVIKFCQECELIVEGTIQTPATSTQDIVFTSWRDDDYGGDTNRDGESKGEEGDWRRIYFKNSLGSELNNVIAKYGGELFPTHPPFYNPSLLPVIHIEGGEVNVKNATITDNFIRGMWIDNSSSTISNVLFSNINNSSSTRPAAALYITEGMSTIQNCTFENNSIGVEIKGGTSTIKSCTFLNNTTGIQIQNGTPYIKNNTFENNEVPISLLPSASPNFFGNIAHTQNNDINGILLEGEKITATSTWKADLPYVIDRNLTITQTGRLILQPGTIVKFKKQNEEHKPSIFIYGKLIAEATSIQPIVFTSFSDDYRNDTNGTSTQPLFSDWYSLRFYSSGSILDNIAIRYGGSTFMLTIGAVAIEEDVDITIQNSVFKNNELPITYEGANCTTTEQKINELKTNYNVIFCDNIYDYKVSPDCCVISSTKCSDL